MSAYFQVAVLAAICEPLTYRVPAGVTICPGQRVIVPLGPRKAMGIAIEPLPRIAPGLQARDILKVLDTEPILSPELVTLGLWMAEYYVAPLGEVFRAMLPPEPGAKTARSAELTDRGRNELARLRSNLFAEVCQDQTIRFLTYVEERSTVSLETARQKFSRAAVDESLKKGWIAVSQRARQTRKVMAVSLTPGLAAAGDIRPKLSPAARRILDALRRGGSALDHRELLKASHATRAALDRLEHSGLVSLSDARTTPRIIPHSQALSPRAALTRDAMVSSLPLAGEEMKVRIELNSGQASALESLTAQQGRTEFAVSLLHGVTGSGKTEVYLRLIEGSLARGISALMLVPEIALTPMLEFEFLRRFGERVAVLHSGLTDAVRREAWWRVWRGEASVVLGTRSAVFAPLKNLGVVIVDEEQDDSYKQQETPRYHGRDVAVVRARLAQALAVLGSATPSLESYSNAQKGKYRLLTLPQRVAGRPLASVEIIDMRQEFRETHTQAPISRRLHHEIEVQLATGAQTMILLNHRGYAWFVLCRSCGEAVRCLNCSITLTYHRREQRLICHYCGYATAPPASCLTCGSEYLHYVGEGTEKIEDKLREMFPSARVERLDRDVASRPGHYRRILSDFREGRIQILAGTQLIAKGHDFPGVTLVGVVAADMGLRLPDFRSAERTFQLLTQAAGRAGRGEAAGRVLVQTFYPEHYAIRLAADQNYPGFFSKEMGFRRVMHYPPAAAMARIVTQDAKVERATETAKEFRRLLDAAADKREVKILGPNPAPLARIERRYRVQILLKSRSRSHLNYVLRRATAEATRKRIPARSLVIDVDPVSMM